MRLLALRQAMLPHRKLLFGLGWSSAAQIAGTLVRLGSTLILTRLLAPEAYALLGTAMVVITTLEWLSDLGIVPALIREHDGATPRWMMTGWSVGLVRGAILSLAGAMSAIPLAWFYGQPTLVGVVAILGLRPFLIALRSPGIPLLRRNLEYRALFVDEIGQTLIGTATSLLLAWQIADPAAGVWALTGGTIAGALAGVVLSYVLAPVRPQWMWDREVAGRLGHFGKAVLLNTLAMALWLNLDRLIGLRIVSVTEFGLYMVAWNLAMALEALLTRLVEIYFSRLARVPLQDRLTWHERSADRVLAIVGPILGMGTVLAPVVIHTLYDSRYHPAGILLTLLSARLFIRFTSQLDFQYLLVQGRLRPATWGYVGGAVVQAMLLAPLGMTWGASGLAIAAGISTVVVALIQASLATDLRGTSLRRLMIVTVWSVSAVLVSLALTRA